MSQPFDASQIRVLEQVLQWVRENPSYFFANGVVTEESLVEQLMAGAQALGAAKVESLAIGGGFVVAAQNDWFASARFPIPEDFNFHALTPFPELGQNCVRPECVVAAFAENIVVRGPSGTNVVKGAIAPSDPMLTHVTAATGWQRAIAFRGAELPNPSIERTLSGLRPTSASHVKR